MAPLLLLLALAPACGEAWFRDPSAGSAITDHSEVHNGEPALKIDYSGTDDWQVTHGPRLDVEPGEIWELRVNVQSDGDAECGPAAVLYDDSDAVIEWTRGLQPRRHLDGWVHRVARIRIPEGAAQIQPRVVGSGPGQVWLQGFTARRLGPAQDLTAELGPKLRLKSPHISVQIDPTNGAMTFTTTARSWTQRPAGSDVMVTKVLWSKEGLKFKIDDLGSAAERTVTLTLDPDRPEARVQIEGEGPLETLEYPLPFEAAKDAHHIVPENEGLDYPAADASIPEKWLVGFGGHGICMGFWGQVEADSACITMLENSDDVYLVLRRFDELLHAVPAWIGQKGEFGYTRAVRYAFFDKGNHVTIAKRYREFAKEKGLLVTLAEKRKKVPAIDKLVGAANVWLWEFDRDDTVTIAQELLDAGIERMLWSQGDTPEELAKLNAMGLLTGRYDIYQDAMDPAQFHRFSWIHPDWTSDAWPHDLMVDENGDWIRGWEVDTTDGQRVPCGVLCDLQAPEYARRRIAENLKTHPFGARFIDTTTASSWRECYHPDHPATRTESRKAKMELLRVVKEEFGMVTGSETGHEAAVPYADYFEGMLSLGPYRTEDSGRDMARIYETAPDQVRKFQVGHAYRLPLWELVYHDCVAAHWYWGDYNNRILDIWDEKDLFNALYGTAPMLFFDREEWRKRKDRIVQTYRTTADIARATGYDEMLDHGWLTPDRRVQFSRFAGGVEVIVNFGDEPFALADGRTVPGKGRVVKGL